MASVLRNWGRVLLRRRQRPSWREGEVVVRAATATVGQSASDCGIWARAMTTESVAGVEERVSDAKEEATKIWRAQQVSDALNVLRTGKGTKAFSRKRAILHLKYLVTHMDPQDVLMLFYAALELGGLSNVCKAAVEGLLLQQGEEEESNNQGGVGVVLQHMDEMVQRSCQAGHPSLAIMLLETAKEHHVHDKVSPESYKALYRLLGEKSRYKTTWEFAEAHGVGGPADVEVVALAMKVAWRANKWVASQRLLESLVLRRVLPVPPRDGALRILYCLLSLIDALAARKAVVEVDYCNMVLRSQVRMGQVDAALDYIKTMIRHHQQHQQQQEEEHGVAATVQGESSLPSSATKVVVLPGPDAHSFSVVLDALGQKGRWPECLELMRETGGILGSSARQLGMVYKTAIAVFGKVGLWEGAMTLFYEMHERGIHIDAQTYTTVTKALKASSQADSALRFLEVMKKQEATPSRMTYNVVLSALGKGGQVDRALQLFEEMKESGLAATSYEYGTLISACGRSGRVDDAMRLLRDAQQYQSDLEEQQDQLVQRQHQQLLEQQQREREEEDKYEPVGGKQQQQDKREDEGEEEVTPPPPGSAPRRRAVLDNCYIQVMKAAGKAGRWRDAIALLEERERKEDGASFVFYKEAMRACAKAGECDMAIALLDSMRQRGIKGHILCYNAAMEACQVAGRWKDALALLERMKKGDGYGPHSFFPGNFCYSRAIQACGDGGAFDEAMALMKELHSTSSECKPDLATYGTFLGVCGQAGQWERVKETLRDMEARGVRPDGLTYVHAIAALMACHRTKDAIELLQQQQQLAASGGGDSSAGDRPRLLAHHVVLLGALEAKDWESFEQARRLVLDSSGLLPTPLTDALLEAAATATRDGGSSSSSSMKMSVEKMRAVIRREVRVNPHDPLRRAKVEVLGFNAFA